MRVPKGQGIQLYGRIDLSRKPSQKPKQENHSYLSDEEDEKEEEDEDEEEEKTLNKSVSGGS